jgi:carbon storage regulator
MLVLSRKPSQQIVVGSEIRITVVRIERNCVRLGIQAPPGIPILRQELTERRPLVLGDAPWDSPPSARAGRTGEPRSGRDPRGRARPGPHTDDA